MTLVTTMIFTIIIFIITLLILVVIHELGHFLVAKRFGIKVLEFGFGIPPRAWGKKVGETLVSINWLPFGGFVRLLGEDEPGPKEDRGPNSRYFMDRPVGQRIDVVLAGVVMNLFLAWLLFYIVLGAQGFKTQLPLILDHQFVGVVQQNESLIIIRQIAKNSPAETVGLQVGDRVMAVDDRQVSGSEDLIQSTKSKAGMAIKLTLSNIDGKEFRSVVVTPRQNPPEGEGPLGVSLAQLKAANLEYASPTQKVFSAPVHSWNLIAYSGKILGSYIGQAFERRDVEPIAQTVAGPVGITSIVNAILTETKNPLIPYLDFVAILSLNLAIMNVLPFPALDGGRLLFLVIEAVTRKKVHFEVERWIHTVGMAILLTLMLLITFSDLRKIFS